MITRTITLAASLPLLLSVAQESTVPVPGGPPTDAPAYCAFVRASPGSPAVSELDCAQWMDVFRGAGMGGVVLDHRCAEAGVLSALAAACSEAGIWMGVSVPDEVETGSELRALVRELAPRAALLPLPGLGVVAIEDGERLLSIEELEDAWYGTIGVGERLLLGVSTDERGRVKAALVAQLGQLRRVLDVTFETNLALDAAAATREAGLALTFPAPVTFDRVVLHERVESGPRVGAFRVVARNGRNEAEIAQGTTISDRCVLRTPITTATEVRVEFLQGPATPLPEVELYLSPPVVTVEPPEADFMGALRIRLRCSLPTSVVRYTLDGSEPTATSPEYKQPLELTSSAEFRARAFGPAGPGVRLCSASYRSWDRSALRPAVHFFRQPDPGLGYALFAAPRSGGDWESLDDLTDAEPLKRGETTQFDLMPAAFDNGFGLRFTGHFFAPEDGIYTFWTTSSDGSGLWIGQQAVVTNDGTHGARERLGRIGLQAGFHPIRLDYFHARGTALLRVEYRGPQSERRPIPASALYR